MMPFGLRCPIRGSRRVPVSLWVVGWILVVGAADGAGFQDSVTTPAEEFGFAPGDDYQLANYSQLAAYWQKLARESDRMELEVIGDTAEGRPIYMAVITSRENHRNLDRLREISRRLALADGVSEDEARELAAEGRAVVWIDGGLHATETLGAQQLIELVFQMVSRSDDETLRFLDDTILLAVCSNPDGLELVADWYMRSSVPEERSLDNLPRLYQKYAGHDNNRDFFMSALPETEAINRVLYTEWFPQIVYNHHQTGPRGTVLFAPPFRDPFNYNFDPLIVTSLDLVAGAMHTRFLSEGKPGATMRSGATYSTWWNGGLRTSPYFHNMIGILTETIGSPTPLSIPPVPRLQLPRGDYPAPVEPGIWHFSQSVDYSMTANRAVLDVASRYRDTLLFNAWRMGMNSIERGSRDNWTVTPGDIARVEDAIGTGRPDTAVRLLRGRSTRDPRGYVIPFDQPDFPTATRFVNALIKNGITVERGTRDFSIGDTTYPVGSYVVKTAQAFRPHIMDMFEPQDYPDDFAYPGAPPIAPYDTTGWTLAYQMGVRFDRILSAFEGPFEPVAGPIQPSSEPGASVVPAPGYFLSHAVNEAFVAINRLLADGSAVFWLSESVVDAGRTYPAGTVYVRAGTETDDLLADLVATSDLVFEPVTAEPEVRALELRPVRIGLWDRYGGSETSGWMRLVLEDFEFPVDLVYSPRLDAGDLTRDFDVLIFPDGAIPATERRRDDPSTSLEEALLASYGDQIGIVTVEDTVPMLGEFMQSGGTVLSVGSSTAVVHHLDLRVEDALAPGPDGPAAGEFYVPGSILRAEVDTSHPLAFGLPETVDVVFDESPAFRLSDEARSRGIRSVAWFGDAPLRSGWARGEQVLDGAAAVVDAPVGEGRLLLYGPEVAFRAQSHGTFKFLFNGIYYPSALPVTLGE